MQLNATQSTILLFYYEPNYTIFKTNKYTDSIKVSRLVVEQEYIVLPDT